MIAACLNGARHQRAHPHVPVTPTELAAAAETVVAVGAFMVHVHPRDESGRETLDARHIVDVATAIRDRVPGLRVSVSTRDGIVGSAREKVGHVAEWPAPEDGGPDSATVNWHEDAAIEVAEALQDNGSAVEAGIWTPQAASRFVATNWPWQVERVLVELIPGRSPGSTSEWAAERILAALGMTPAPILVHGEGQWAWPALRWAQASGFDVRIGLEDTLVLPSGRETAGNAELVKVALASGGGAPTQWPVPDPL